MFDRIIHLTGGDHDVTLQYRQILIVAMTAVLLGAFWYLVQKTALGRAQRACEQDRKMAALIGVDVDRDDLDHLRHRRGARRGRRRACTCFYYGVVNFSDGFLPGVKAFTAAVLGGIGSLPGAVLGGLLIGLIESLVVGLFLDRLQGRRGVLDPRDHADLHALGHPRPARNREGVSDDRASQTAPSRRTSAIRPARSRRCATAAAALIAFGLCFPIIMLRAEADITTARL